MSHATRARRFARFSRPLVWVGAVAGTLIGVSALAAADPVAAAPLAADPLAAARRIDRLLSSDDGSPDAAAAKSAAGYTPAAESAKWADDSASRRAAKSRPGAASRPAESARPALASMARSAQAAPRTTSNLKAPAADDETFIRRATLDVLGEQPSPEAITAFVLDPARDKRAALVDRLLADPDYGHNWARYWRDVIFYRRSDDRALIMAGTLVAYLTDELNRNVPWDKIARSFIAATGDIIDNGETGLIMSQMASPEDTTAEVSRIFLGIQIQCAQCHNHPTDRWKREQFHEMAAFFTRVVMRRELLDGAGKLSFRVAGDDVGRGRRAPGAPEPISLEHYMPDLKDPQAKGTLTRPVFFATGQALELGATDRTRRESLAKWITAPTNSYFAEAFVNRMWSELVGRGFVEPVDDMSPDRPAQSPQTLKFLANEFTASRYDIKWLFRAIMATEAYQRQSRSRSETVDPLANSCPQRLRADQLTNALFDALGIDESAIGRGLRLGGGLAMEAPSGKDTAANMPADGAMPAERAMRADGAKSPRHGAKSPADGGKSPGEPPRKPANAAGSKRYGFGQGLRGQAAQTFGYDPSVRRDELAGTIPQALWLMNGGLVSLGARGGSATGLARLLADEPNDESVAVELYLRCLARQPKPAELSTCLAHVKAVGREEGFEDVLWSLLNSTEFLYRK